MLLDVVVDMLIDVHLHQSSLNSCRAQIACRKSNDSVKMVDVFLDVFLYVENYLIIIYYRVRSTVR